MGQENARGEQCGSPLGNCPEPEREGTVEWECEGAKLTQRACSYQLVENLIKRDKCSERKNGNKGQQIEK